MPMARLYVSIYFQKRLCSTTWQVLIPLGSVICVFAMMMVSLTEQDQPYQLFLSQGVLYGLGLALM